MRRVAGSFADAPRSVLRVDEFLGLDLEDAGANRSPKRSPDGVNMVRDVPGKIRKRMGYHKTAQYAQRINGLHEYAAAQESVLLVHAGTALYKGDAAIYEGLADDRSQAYQLGEQLFICDGQMLLCYDGEAVFPAAEKAYVPTLTIGRGALGGGKLYEALNLLGGRFCDSFLADGSSTVFQLSYTELDDTPVQVQLRDAAGVWTTLSEDAYSVQRQTGQVTLKSAPAAPADAADNLRITAGKEFAENRRMVDGCRFGVLYGVNGEPNRLFLSGNSAWPNRDWHSELNNALYFPQDGYSVLGQGSAVTAYSITGNYLAAHKRAEPDGRNIIIRMGAMEDGRAVFPIVNSLQGAGTLAAAAVAYPADEPLFLSEGGILAITTSDIKGERYTQERSYYIASALAAQQNREQAQAAAYHGFYVLALDGRCWLLDTKQKSSEAGAPYSAHQYEAFLFDNIPARVLKNVGGQLMFGTEDGAVMAFYTDPADPASYMDDGKPIAAHWDLDFDGSRFYKAKRLRYLALRMAPFDNTSFAVSVLRQGAWQPLFEETQRLRRLSFDSIDFDNFSFSCDENAVSVGRKVGVGRFDALRLRVSNDRPQQPMGLYELALEYSESGKYRR